MYKNKWRCYNHQILFVFSYIITDETSEILAALKISLESYERLTKNNQ